MKNNSRGEDFMKKIELNEIKKIEIGILKYIDDICKKNNIEYCLTGGSLIGAIRHGGFIPWDDDIDILLTSENCKKLKNAIEKDDNYRYKLLTHETQNDYFYPFFKVVDTYTIMEEKRFKKIENYGVYIDVFSIYNCPNDDRKRKKFYNKIKRLKQLIFYYALKNPFNSTLIKNILKIPIVVYARIIGINKILNKFEKLQMKYQYQNSEYMLSNWPTYGYEHEILKSEDINSGVTYHKFENIEALIPNNYDTILRTVYGNYMQLPPKEKQITNHIIEVYWKADKADKVNK